MNIAIGCDHGGFELKEQIRPFIEKLGHEVKDFGCDSPASVDYPDYAEPVARAVARGEFEKGILICGTGIGVSIVANKIKGVRCALCGDSTSARLTREHNDSNILAMGARIIGLELAKDIVKIWLETAFVGAHHTRRVARIGQIEQEG